METSEGWPAAPLPHSFWDFSFLIKPWVNSPGFKVKRAKPSHQLFRRVKHDSVLVRGNLFHRTSHESAKPMRVASLGFPTNNLSFGRILPRMTLIAKSRKLAKGGEPSLGSHPSGPLRSRIFAYPKTNTHTVLYLRLRQ